MTDLPKIALGAWAWGSDGTFGGSLSASALKPVFETAMANSLNLWDTAYAYGMGTSEKILAGFIKDHPRDFRQVHTPVRGLLFKDSDG